VPSELLIGLGVAGAAVLAALLWGIKVGGDRQRLRQIDAYQKELAQIRSKTARRRREMEAQWDELTNRRRKIRDEVERKLKSGASYKEAMRLLKEADEAWSKESSPWQ
jgi:septal ring factor EnvC (AmiA/AmiB activator)